MDSSIHFSKPSTQLPQLFLLHLKKLFIFNWRIIALQYCVHFCHKSTWVSHRYTCIAFLLSFPPTSHPTHSSRLSQSTWLVLHESYSKLPLTIILCMVIYMFPCYFLSFFHFLLPSLCPQVCSLCLWLHCFPANRFISTIFLDPIYMS